MAGNQSNSDDERSERQGGQQPRGGKQRDGGQRGGQRRQQQGQRQQGQPHQQQGQRQQGQPRQQQGQRQQGQPRQQAQPRRQPPGRGGSSFGGIDTGSVTGIVATMSIAGILMGILSVLLSVVGGFSALPGSVVAARSDLQDAASGTGGLQSGQSQLEVVNQAVSTAHEAVVTAVSTEVAPFIALVLAVVVGAALALKSTGDDNVVSAGIGGLIGGFLFMILAIFVTSLVFPSLGDGVPSGIIYQFSVFTGENGAILTLQMTNLLINAVVVGVVTGITAAGTTFSVDRFFPE